MTDDHRVLIERLFPALAVRTCTPIGDGWTSLTFEVNGEWIVQLPASEYAAGRLRMQSSLLPELAHEVSALVPVPEYVATDPPALAYRRLDGAPADPALDGLWPERLGRFLHDLHSVPPEFVGMRASTPNAIRDAERAAWSALRADVADRVPPADLASLDGLVSSLLDDGDLWSFAPVLVHGDLGPAHVLVGAGGDLVGVIDWEEAGIGDPSVDFAWWLREMPAVGTRALAAYGDAPDRHFRERADLRWALMPWHDVHHGVVSGTDAFVASGLAGARARHPAASG
jgi:aminoglycoside phosphotransferase (APT) family kinase protein